MVWDAPGPGSRTGDSGTKHVTGRSARNRLGAPEPVPVPLTVRDRDHEVTADPLTGPRRGLEGPNEGLDVPIGVAAPHGYALNKTERHLYKTEAPLPGWFAVNSRGDGRAL